MAGGETGGASALGDLTAVLRDVLGSDRREAILDEVLGPRGPGRTGPLHLLRQWMEGHTFGTGTDRVTLEQPVHALDRRTREEGFHVLQAWDFKRLRFTQDEIPVLLLEYYEYLREGSPAPRASAAILLDFYFLHILSLAVMRIWDAADPDAAIEEIGELLHLLQGPRGSGHQFIATPETLLILAVSHFHPDDRAYDRLIERVCSLAPLHQLVFAMSSSAALGSHLRWGMEEMYKGDRDRMRADNVGDYPWLLYAVGTLLEAYAEMRGAGIGGAERDAVVSALLNGISADPEAFLGGEVPAFLPWPDDHAAAVALLREALEPMRAEINPQRPVEGSYSPLSLTFNFPNNALVAGTTSALLRGTVQRVPLDALLLGERRPGGTGDPRPAAAKDLMDYSSARPERMEGGGSRLIIYDPVQGLRSYNRMLSLLYPEG
jgi:hypothetical protein